MGASKLITALGDSSWISVCWSPRNLDLVKKPDTKNEPSAGFHSDNGDNSNFCTLTVHTPSMESYFVWTYILNSIEANNYLHYDRSKHSSYRPLLLRMALPLRIIHGSDYTYSKDT